MKKALLLLAVLALTLSLTACGDSGSSDDPQPSVVKKLTGCVSGAPVKGAKVYAKSSCLLEEVRKGKDGNKDILVGRTDKDGCIIFDEAALCKLDRTKNVFLYSKGGMVFNCEYDCEEDANLKGGVDKKCYFRGQLRAILAPGAWCVNLTLPNTIAHDLVVDCGKSLEEANNLVKKLICCWMSIKLMEDPLGNACCDIVNYEYIAQALLLGMGSNEDGLANNTPEYREALARTVKKLCYWNCRTQERLDEFRAVARQIERVKAAMLPVLGEAYRTEIQCLTREDILSDKVYTTALGKKCLKPIICDLTGKDCCYIPYSRYYPPRFNFKVISCSNKERCNGKFTICELPDCGELYANYKRVSVGDTFEGTQEFTFKVTREEYRNLLGKKVLFKFKACDGCYVPDIVVCGKYLCERDIAVSSFKHKKAPDCRCDLYAVEAMNEGKFDLSVPGRIKLASQEVRALDAAAPYIRMVPADLKSLLTFTTEGVGMLEKGQMVRAEVEAPKGFVFAYGSEVTEEYKATHVVSPEGDKLIVSEEITEEKAASEYAEFVMFDDVADANKLELRSAEEDQVVTLSHIHASIFANEELVGRCGYDESEDNADGCELYIVADESQTIAMEAVIGEVADITSEDVTDDAAVFNVPAETPIAIDVKSWMTESGRDCQYNSDDYKGKWTCEVAEALDAEGKAVEFKTTSGDTTTYTTGFGEASDIKGEVALDKEESANAKGKAKGKKLEASFAAQPFVFGAGVESAKLRFKYQLKDGDAEVFNGEPTRTFTLKRKPAPAPEEGGEG
ncbi:hypothetical protein [Halodesulfovibrio spirochaetisodalis]|uniref:Uncharacterized protein n=1 Tax=Halodesulfovibrio spirochaetisodalis TaxID=1560234 RepID=A0A1B7XAK6_9BACT|nr:hypothetical protein [Halodesulfovibrio spirochaetisodalis]OBQ46385.1 hypothetical protein SP90_12690 [Halodesulfovibrio spirochaetisodalis]